MPSDASAPILPIRELLASMPFPIQPIAPSSQPSLPQSFPPLPTPPPPWAFFTGVASASVPSTLPTLAAETDNLRLRDGCYAVVFKSSHPDLSFWPSSVGTLRWEQLDAHHVIASADLYLASAPLLSAQDIERALSATAGPSPVPQNPNAIPIYPRDRYQAYFQISTPWIPEPLPKAVKPLASTPSAPLVGSWHRIRNAVSNLWFAGTTVCFHPISATSDPHCPSGPCLRAKFNLTDTTGLLLGELHVRWISPFFRDAVVEIDTEPGLDAPVHNGAHDSWESVFAVLGWSVRTETGRVRIPTPPSGRWTYAELHDGMVASRAYSDLDSEWRYHVIVVHSFADPIAPIAIAFDHESMDLNGIPREGVAIYGGAALPDLPLYGRYAGRVLSTCPDLYFKIALHEIGHAMGLHHNHLGFGVMEQVDDLAKASPAHQLDRVSLLPRFAPDDIFRLRHLPDIQIRPGGADFETSDAAEDHEDVPGFPHVARSRATESLDARSQDEPLILRLALPSSQIPVGAPIRVDFQLLNPSAHTVVAPSKLSLATPYVSGAVVQPDGTENPFRSFFKPVDLAPFTELGPRGLVRGSLTLLRGRLGALNPRPGQHNLWVEIAWTHAGRRWSARQYARFQSLAAHTPEESRAARRLLRTPETLPFLILGPTRSFPEGEAAVDAALDVAALRPHFLFIKAKASATPYRQQAPDWEAVHALLSDESPWPLLNQREREKACTLRAIAEIKMALTGSLTDLPPR